jgi:cytochrome c oxidase subunit 2
LSTLLLVFLLQVHVPGTPKRRVTNIFKPLASLAEADKNIALLALAITGAIFLTVAAVIVYTIYRFRRRPSHDVSQEPLQVYGSNQIELAWTVIPILIACVLIGVTARVIASVQNASPPPSTLHVTLVGHQWWWEVIYPDYKITTANEIHVPASPDGTLATYFKLQSVDVIHSFWVPQFAGKTDLIPNRDNFAWIDPRQPGAYVGNCAEYCGTQHANMLLRVIAETPEDFKKWTVGQQEPAKYDPQVMQAKAVFESFGCVTCHTIRGTSAAGKFGPDLTHLISRQTLGAGVLVNTRENLRDWVNDPQISNRAASCQA